MIEAEIVIVGGGIAGPVAVRAALIAATRAPGATGPRVDDGAALS